MREEDHQDEGLDEERDELELRAEEARELDRNPQKHEEYRADVEAELDDLEEMEGPDA